MTQQYKECPNCHAHLDPGERCDCGGDDDRDGAIAADAEPGPTVQELMCEDRQLTRLQSAYAAHMMLPNAKRLKWMEAAIDSQLTKVAVMACQWMRCDANLIDAIDRMVIAKG